MCGHEEDGAKKRADQSALWSEAGRLAREAADVLVAIGLRDPNDADTSELHESIFLRLGGRPSNPERRPD